MNVPKLRFKEFTGEWEEKRLSNYLNVNTARNKNNVFDKNDVLSVSGEFGIVNQILFQGRSFAGESVELYHIVETGDIVYTKSPLKANPYGIIKYNGGSAGIVSTLYAVYHCKPNCNGKFVEHYFDNDLRLNKYLKPLVNIGAKHDMKISDENALSGNVIIPSYDEQCKIDSFLKIIDERIEKQKDIIDTLAKQKKALMQKIFSQELRFKDDDGKEFPAWEEKKLGEVVLSISSGKNKYRDDFGKFPVYGSTGKIGYANKVEYSGEMLLIARVGANAGLLNYIDEECGVSDNTLVIKMQEKYNTKYFFYVLQEYNLNKLTFGSGQPLVTSSMIKNILIFIPSECEQNKITEFLTRIDFRIKNAQEQLEHWQQIKKGLLQQMFV